MLEFRVLLALVQKVAPAELVQERDSALWQNKITQDLHEKYCTSLSLQIKVLQLHTISLRVSER